MDNLDAVRSEFVRNNRLNIGLKIRQYRIMKSFSQQHLADLMGISRATISKIENGKFSISIDYLAKFAWHLDFDVRLFEKSNLSK
jgi:transcriptional regulator with XRE-family HTH domain